MNDKCFHYIVNLYFMFKFFYHNFMVYIILIFSSSDFNF